MSTSCQHSRTNCGACYETKTAHSRSSRKEDDLPPEKWALAAWEALEIALTRADRDTRELLSSGKTKFLETYQRRTTDGTSAAWLKFHSATVFSISLLQQELPRSPDGTVVPDVALKEARRTSRVPVFGSREDDGCFAPGPVSRALKRVMKRAVAGNKVYRSVAYDILNMKTGCPRVSSEFVASSYSEHRENICKEHEPASPTVLDGLFSKNLQDICRSVYSRRSVALDDVIPSFNGCYEGSISKGGAMHELFNQFMSFGLSDRDRADVVASIQNPSGCEELVAMYEDGPSNVREVRLPCRDQALIFFHEWIDDIVKSRLSSTLCAKPAAVVESLKVRMVTKGEAAEYYRCTDLQKALHRPLAGHAVFEWIGKPIDDDSWDRAFLSCLPLKSGQFFNSGDYKAATDNLDPRVTEECWRYICRYLRVPGGSRPISIKIGDECGDWDHHYLFHLGLKALVRHELFYPAKRGRERKLLGPGEGDLQKWGQLMGSPMSFPILCIINAAACITAMGRRYKDCVKRTPRPEAECAVSLGDLPLLSGTRGSDPSPIKYDLPLRVNGDDCVFLCDDLTYRSWKLITEAIGLRRSVGKSYCSPLFALMNSELRWVKGGTRFKLEGFVNQSLFRGLVRKGPQAAKPANLSFLDVGPNLRGALRGIGSHHRELIELGLKSHKRILDLAPSTCSWWLPQHLGGLGLPTWEPLLDCVSREKNSTERLVAAAYLTSSEVIARERPVPSKTGSAAVDRIIRQINSRCPPCWRMKRNTQEDWRERLASGPSGMTGFLNLSSMLELTEAEDWEPSEKVVDNRGLARKWSRWIQPGLELGKMYVRNLADGCPEKSPLRPMELVDVPTSFHWDRLVTLPRWRSSRHLYGADAATELLEHLDPSMEHIWIGQDTTDYSGNLSSGRCDPTRIDLSVLVNDDGFGSVLGPEIPVAPERSPGLVWKCVTRVEPCSTASGPNRRERRLGLQACKAESLVSSAPCEPIDCCPSDYSYGC